MLLMKYKLFPVPHIFSIPALAYHMDVHRFMVMTEK